MSRFTTIRRRLLLGAGFVLVLSGFSLCVMHTSLVRRFALVQIQTRLGNTQGLVLEARNLDYNLLTSRFELRDVVLKGAGLADSPAPLKAQRVLAVIPVWRALRGSLETAQIRIDGLSVNWTTGRDGRSNWPALPSNGNGTTGGPAIQVTSGELYMEDHRNGFLLELPHLQFSAAWNQAKHEYGIACENAGGELQWNQMRLALDQFQLRSALVNGNLVVESMQVVSGKSKAEIRGMVAGSPARLEASANLDLDVRHLSQALAPSTTARGRLQVRLSAGGPVQAVLLNADVRGNDLVIGRIPIRTPLAQVLVDTATGEVCIRTLSAELFSGKLLGRGTIRTAGNHSRSEFKGSLRGMDLSRVGSALSYSGFPSGPANVAFDASWPGVDWRFGMVSGVAQWRSARVTYKATSAPGSVRAAFNATLGDGSEMHSDAALSLADHAIAGVVRGKIGSLAQLDLLNVPVNGAADWSGTIGGTLEHPSASVQVDVNGLSVGAWNGADLHVEAGFDAGRISIGSARLVWAGQQIEAKGGVDGVSADAPLRLEGTIEGRSLAAVSEKLGIAPVGGGAVKGEFRVAGTVDNPTGEATLRTGELTAYGQQFARTSLDARWQHGTLTVNHLSAEQDHETGRAGHVEVAGLLATSTGQYTIEATGQNLRASAAALPDGGGLVGVWEIEAHGKGALADPVFSAKVIGSDVTVGTTVLGELHASIDAAGHRMTAALAAPALNAKVTSTIAMEGAWPFELRLDARNTHLDTTPAVSFDATVRTTGTLAVPCVESAAATVQNLRLETPGQETRSDGPIELSFADGQVNVERLALKSAASVLQVRGAMPLQDGGTPGAVTVKGNLHLGPLARWVPGAGGLQIGGVAELNARVSGSVQNWHPSGTVTLREGRFLPPIVALPFENISGLANLQDGVIRFDQIAGKAGTGTFRLDASLPLTPTADQPARFSAQFDKLHFAGGSGGQAVTTTIGLKAEGEAASLSLAALRANVEVSELAAVAPSGPVTQTAPVRIAIAEGSARLEQLDLRGSASTLKASGSIGLTGQFPLQFEAAGETDLAILAALTPAFDAAGTAQLNVRLGGTLSAPETSGFVQLDHASLAIPNPRVMVANVKLRADLEGDHVTLKELSGTLNGGPFKGGGDFKAGITGIRDANLFLTAKDAFLEFPTAVKTTSSVDLKLLSRNNELVLQGQVDVQEGYYESSIDLFSKSPQGLDLGPVEAVTPSNPVALDVKIATKRPVEMDNNLGRISATANLRLAGTVNQPKVLGRMELEEEGRLYFGDRTYYIERGTVRFLDAPRVTPELNIQAYTRTNDYTIRLGLTGQLNDVTTTFTSDPPLSRDDVIAVLLTGKTVAENRGVDLRALEATSLATGALNAALSSRLNRTLGVSRVSIQPTAIAAESNPGARVTITQDFTRSLRLLYSMNLSDSNDQIWVGEYDLSRHFTTRAVKQSDNTYRGEFRHDIRFGSSSPPANPIAAPTKRKIASVQFTGAGPFSPAELAKVIKLKPGQKYQAAKVRKGSERLGKFFTKRGYLESRVRLDRDEAGEGVGLTARIELGPIVELAYQGANLPKKQKTRLRNVWHAGISDQQRPQMTKDAILTYYAKKGYLRAEAESHVASEGERKLVRFDFKPGTHYRGVKIVVEGAERQRVKEILSVLHEGDLKTSVYRNPGRVIDAVTGFYQQRGYLAVKIAPPRQELDPLRKTGRVVISAEEGPVFRVGTLQFAGNQALAPQDLRTGIPLETGAVFEPARLEPTLSALKRKYGRLGYRGAKIEYEIARHDDRAEVDVSFAVAENQQTSIGAIRVEGNRHTSEKFARGQLKVKEGQVTDTMLVRESLKNLSQTGAYASAEIRVQPQAESGTRDNHTQVADLVVAVAEPKPFRLLYGGLYDSGNGPGFIADFQNRNSLGAGRVLGLRTRVDSETDEARIYVTRPFWRQSRLSTTLATYFTRQTEYHQSTPTETLGASIQQDVQLRSKLLLSYGYRFERQRGFIPDPAAPNIPEKVVSVAPATLTISRDARDSFLDATRGSFISHGFELAPRFLGSDYPYVRYYLQYFKYFSLTHPRPVPYGEQARRSRLVFATGSRLGLQKGFNSAGAVLTDRFYAGGGTTVRGFKQDELGPRLANGKPAGGNAVLVLNEELRYPLVWVFDAVSFIDIGNVYPRVSDFRFKDLRTAGGFGIRIRNPFVVLRFDYGFKFNRRPGETMGAFFFSIGQAF